MSADYAPFRTLLLREWMQHRRGWLILAAVPFVLMLLGVSFGEVHLGEHIDAAGMATPAAALVGLASIAMSLTLMWIAVLLQSPGLARRDVQDRSIEFWLSLPTPPALSIATTLLAHLLLAPLFALACGLAGGLVLAPLVVLKTSGFAALGDVAWGSLLQVGAALGLRLTIGLALATLWLSPLLLSLMAASAWLKRWGAAGLVGFVLVGGAFEKLIFHTKYIHRSVGYLLEQGLTALIGTSAAQRGTGLHLDSPADLVHLLPSATQWLFSDLAMALRDLATPALAAALLVAAGSFALLVLRRQRAG